MSTSELSTYAPQAPVPQTTAAGGRRPPRNLLLGMMVAVFFSGGVIGSGSTLMLINRRIEDNEKHHNDPVIMGHRVVEELQEKLSLDEAQTTEVDQIMKDHFAALDRVRREDFFPKIREQFKQMEDQVNAVLDNEQRTQWHAWLDERRKRVCPPNGRHNFGSHNSTMYRGRAAKPGQFVKPDNSTAAGENDASSQAAETPASEDAEKSPDSAE
jgi:hypothetical protein